MSKTAKTLLLALLGSVALPAMAQAETLTVTDIKGGVAGEVEVIVPRVEAVDASLDEAAIRAIFAEGVAGRATDLAGLDAASITIPEIKLVMLKGKEGPVELTYKDIVISGVTDGVAQSVSVGGASSALAKQGTMEIGKMSAEDFNIAGLLGFYGLTDAGAAADAPPQVIYRNFAFDGAKLTSDEVSCTLGSMQAEEFRARPLKTSFADFIALAEGLEGDKQPSPAEVGQLMSFYADLLTAFESSPISFSGLDCNGKTEKGEPLTIAVGPINMDGFTQGVTPAVSVDGIKIEVEGDGVVQVGSLTSKSTDFTAVIAALKAAPAELTEAWFEANYRKLIPAIGGFAFSGLAVDVPDEDKPGTRIKAQVAEFDLSLGAYVNGIPTEISNAASGIVVALPEGDDTAALRELGITEINADYAIGLHWDEAANTIVIDQVAFSGDQLGSAALYGTIGNATAALFGENLQLALVSAMGLTLKDVQLDLHDDGIAAIAASKAAAEQGQDVDSFRKSAADMAGGAILGILAGTDTAQQVADAVSAFIGGSTPDLSIIATAKSEAGISLPELMAAENDPKALIAKVDLSAFNNAEGEAGEADDADEPEVPAAPPADDGKTKNISN